MYIPSPKPIFIMAPHFPTASIKMTRWSALLCLVTTKKIRNSFQNFGIGTKAVQLALEKFKEMGATEVYLSYEPENHIADALYRKFGWLPTGKIEEGEIVMLLKLDKVENHV
jgi:hypothetical protein